MMLVQIELITSGSRYPCDPLKSRSPLREGGWPFTPFRAVFNHVFCGMTAVTRHRLPRIFEAYFKPTKDHALGNITVNFVELYDANAVFNVDITLFGEEKAANRSRF